MSIMDVEITPSTANMSVKELEIKELQEDAKELTAFLASATRKRVKEIFSTELLKIETRLKHLESSNSGIKNDASNESKTNTRSTYTTVIRNYSWDQSDKFLKLYVPLPGVQDLEKEHIVSDFGKKSVTLLVSMLAGKNYELKILNLAYAIVPDRSYHKVKTDMVIIFAAKEKSLTWEAVTAEEKKVKDSKKGSKEQSKSDPSGGLMDLMKQMYEDGDDEMKRMLNKTWYESQQKTNKGGGLPDMDDLNL